MLKKLLNKKRIKKMLIFLVLIGIIGVIYALAINFYVIYSTKKNVISADKAGDMQDVDCILVLGAGVYPDGNPSPMLYDRIMTSVSLYKNGSAPKIIMSGDHGSKNYDEVNTMKSYAMAEGIPSSDIFMDHAGFSTYESIYRAKEVFQADKIIIVTQEYHLYRALHIADKLNIEAVGVSADLREYYGQFKRELREILARNKDFLLGIFKPLPKYLGETIPVSGDGEITND